MAQLPQEFLTRMQEMLGDEFDAFLTSYDAPRTAGLRVNTKKCRTEDFPSVCSISAQRRAAKRRS